MKKVLDPLVRVPGVRRAMMIAPDGVPIVHSRSQRVGATSDGESSWNDSADDVNAFAGLAAGWLNEVHRAVDPMSWSTPQRVVLRAARGTLVLLANERVLLSVELERGASPEELRLPMEAALARLQRTLRRGGRSDENQGEAEIPGIFPGQEAAPSDGESCTGSQQIQAPTSQVGAASEESRSASSNDPNSAGDGAAPNHSTGNQVP